MGVAVSVGAQPAGADPFFGTWSDHMSLPREQSRLEMDRQAAAGLGVIRAHIFWDRIETEPNVFFWARLDEVVQDAADRGLQILPVLLTPPAFYVTRPANAKPNVQYPPDDPAAMARFARKLVERYGPHGTFWCSLRVVCRRGYAPVRAWQVWNEPNLRPWWKDAPNAGEYAALLRSVSASIKASDRNAEVVMGGLGPISNAVPYLNELYDAQASANRPFFDTLAIHGYGATVPEAVDVVRRIRQAADARGGQRTPIWVTEYGWATGGLHPWIITTADCQAALVYAATTSWKQLRGELNLRGAIQFQWRDIPTTSREEWPHYAGLNPVDFAATPKPTLDALIAGIVGRPPAPTHTIRDACPPLSGGEDPLSDRIAPRFDRALSSTPSRFRAILTRSSARTRKAHQMPSRGAFSFSLSEPAAVTIVIGRQVRRACRSSSPADRHRARCTRYARVGSVRRRQAAQGDNLVTFNGRLGSRRLPPGRYRASATARDSAGNVSRVSRSGFVVVR